MLGSCLVAPWLLRGEAGLAHHLALEASAKAEVALVVLGKEEAEVSEVLARVVVVLVALVREVVALVAPVRVDEASVVLVRAVLALEVLASEVLAKVDQAKEVVDLGVVVAALAALVKAAHPDKAVVDSEVRVKAEVDSEAQAREVPLVKVVAALEVQVKEADLSEAEAVQPKEVALIKVQALVGIIREVSMPPRVPLHTVHLHI